MLCTQCVREYRYVQKGQPVRVYQVLNLKLKGPATYIMYYTKQTFAHKIVQVDLKQIIAVKGKLNKWYNFKVVNDQRM